MKKILLSLTAFSPAWALTLDEALDFSIEHSPVITIQLKKREIAQAELSKSYGQFLPKISLSSEFSDQKFADGSDATYDSYWHREYDVEMTQNIFDGLSSYHQINQNRSELRSAQGTFHNSVYDLTVDLAKLVYEIDHSQSVISMAKENYNKIMEIKDLIEKRVKEGVSKDIDLVQAKGRLAVAKTNLLESIRQLRGLKAQFTEMTGGLEAENLIKPIIRPLDNLNFKELWLKVQTEGAMLSPYYDLEQSAKYNYKAQQGNYLPTVDLYASYKYEKGLSENPNTLSKTRNIGLKAQWVIFDGGKQTLDTYIHARKYQQARLETKKQRQNLEMKALTAWENYHLLTDAIPFLEEHTQSTFKTTQSYFDQFLLGQKSLLDLLDAHNELLRARKNEYYNKMLQKHNRLDLSHLSGSLLSDLNLSSLSGAIKTESQMKKMENFLGVRGS